MSFLYLASPYSYNTSHLPREEREAVMLMRFRGAMYACAWFLTAGNKPVPTYSPIVHCHEMAERCDLPTGAEFWQHYNFAMLESSSGLIVLALQYWMNSDGVQGEIEKAKSLDLPIRLLRPDLEKGYKLSKLPEEGESIGAEGP